MDENILDSDLTQNNGSATEVTYAGFWIRVGATLVDFLILLPVFLLTMYNMFSLKSMLLMIVLTLVSAAYKPYLEWKRSATYGKSAVGIKLIDYEGNNISLEQALKRYFPWIISYVLSLISSIFLFMAPEFAETEGFMEISTLTQKASPVNAISSLYNFVFLILIGSAGFDSRKQGVHDKYAKTYCVYEK